MCNLLRNAQIFAFVLRFESSLVWLDESLKSPAKMWQFWSHLTFFLTKAQFIKEDQILKFVSQLRIHGIVTLSISVRIIQVCWGISK